MYIDNWNKVGHRMIVSWTELLTFSWLWGWLSRHWLHNGDTAAQWETARDPVSDKIEGENPTPKAVLWPLHMYGGKALLSHTCKSKQNWTKKKP